MMDKKLEWVAITVALVLGLTGLLTGLIGGNEGPMGPPGQSGVGLQGVQGPQGATGLGTQGPQGLQGVPGVGLQGPIGPRGDEGQEGETGHVPSHEWSGTSIRFMDPDNSWGSWIDLKGDSGENLEDKSDLLHCQLYADALLVSRGSQVGLYGTGFPAAPQLFFKDAAGKNTHLGLFSLVRGTFAKVITIPASATLGLGYFIAYTDGTGETPYTTWPIKVN